MNAQELFKRFANDIIYNCHSLRASVSRSGAGRQIIADGPNILRDLATHLKDYKPSTEIEALADEVRHGWGILLSWMCEEHSLDREGIAQGDFNAWVAWVTKHAQAST